MTLLAGLMNLPELRMMRQPLMGPIIKEIEEITRSRKAPRRRAEKMIGHRPRSTKRDTRGSTLSSIS